MISLHPVLDWLDSAFTLPVMVILLFSGVVSMFVDAPELRKKGLEKDRRAAVGVGVAAMILAPTLWIIIRVLTTVLPD